MENLFSTIFVFCLVLVIYLHVIQHLKKSDDLEIYELDEEIISPTHLDEILMGLQPTVFDLQIDPSLTKPAIEKFYHAFEIKVRDMHEDTSLSFSELYYLPIAMSDAMKLFQKENNPYFSENNEEFLVETGLIKKMRKYDELLRPPLVCTTNYDILFAPKQFTTPLRYHLDYRRYFMVMHGTLKIRLTPPKSSKYLNPINDYENMEFRSLANLWNNQQQCQKVKCMELEITQGRIISIPPYWWYSLRFETTDTTVASFSYRTYFNLFSISPYLFISMLQNHNVRKIVSKTLKLDHDDEQQQDEEQQEERNDFFEKLKIINA